MGIMNDENKEMKKKNDAYKEVHEVGIKSDGVFCFGQYNKDASNTRCNLNVEHVKEIGEMIGISKKLAEEKNNKERDRDDNKEDGPDGVQGQYKLDRFLLNEEFNELWDNLLIIALDRKLLDHFPIVLKDVELNFGPKPFWVFNIWLDEPDFLNIVEGAWKEDVRSTRSNCIFRDRLKNVKKSLRDWSKDRFGGHKESIENLKKEAMRIRWDVEGDENSKFFHSFVTGRNNKCNLRGLLVNGAWCEDLMVIKAEMAKHYRELFSDAEKDLPIFCSPKVMRISMEEAQMLEMIFSENEVWEAISGCGGNKAPGPDGFNFKFIRKVWEVIKQELLRTIAWFWKKMEISKGVMLRLSLLFLRFRIRLVDTCLKSSSMSILVNGSPLEEFRLERGVRQGDPLSPFLFILAAKGLNVIFSEAVEKCIFRGVEVGENNVMVSHVQYLDDTIFFREWDKENAKMLMCILKCFEKVYGLQVNCNKRKIYGIGVNEEEMREMESWMGCGVVQFLFTYLGLPIGENIRSAKAWGPVVEKFKKRLADWKAKRCRPKVVLHW
nr:transposon TX1 uncharacterized [Tanacetum cinerariifolium]